MKKIILFLVVLFTLTGCIDGLLDYEIATNYIYRNDTSSDITITSYTPNGPLDTWTEIDGWKEYMSFVIPADEERIATIDQKRAPGDKTVIHTRGRENNYIPPMSWQSNATGRDYTLVSNGERIVKQTVMYNDELYRLESYTLIDDELRNATFLYVFTDDFFANGELVE